MPDLLKQRRKLSPDQMAAAEALLKVISQILFDKRNKSVAKHQIGVEVEVAGHRAQVLELAKDLGFRAAGHGLTVLELCGYISSNTFVQQLWSRMATNFAESWRSP